MFWPLKPAPRALQVYAAPYQAPNVLVLDTATDAVYGVDRLDVYNGNFGWVGITPVGTKVTERARAHSYILSRQVQKTI